MSTISDVAGTTASETGDRWNLRISVRNRASTVYSFVFLGSVLLAVSLLLLLLGVLIFRGWDWLTFDLFLE
jgi:hypothetical protein